MALGPRECGPLGPVGEVDKNIGDNLRGISHNEAESAEPEHVAAAAQIIADILVDLANGP